MWFANPLKTEDSMYKNQFLITGRTICISLMCWLLLSGSNATAQTKSISNNYRIDSGLVKLKADSSFIYIPVTGWFYSHHPYICRFKDRWIAIWSNGKKDEDAPGQRVVFSVSKDFFHWSDPKVLANPSTDRNGITKTLTAAGFHVYGDTLTAYFGEYSVKRTHTQLFAMSTADGEHWGHPVDLHIPVNPNFGPEPLVSGRLVICGNISFPYTDDPRGLSAWKMSSFYPDSLFKEDNPATFESPAVKSGLPPLCEASFFQTDDGIVHALLRATGDGWKGRLWLTESKDNAAHWSFPTETGFTDNDSKFHFGQLPDKRFYYVGNPDTLHHDERNPLVLALSQDGVHFNQQFIIARSVYKLNKPGLWKEGQYGYPHSIIDHGYLIVIVSRLKEAVEIFRIDLQELK
ncbi:MAG: exo-alpha-sialidase [Bacteroidota bacterium]|nr:exo-alpha-sialidase [Bacteroidota bacterium]